MPDWRPRKKTRAAKGGANRLDVDALFESASVVGSRLNRLVIGIDPDLRTAGISIFCSRAGPLAVGCTELPKSPKGQLCVGPMYRATRAALRAAAASEIVVGRLSIPPVVVVEGQRIRRAAGASTKNPQSLVDLAACSGAAIGAALSVWPNAEVIVVEPGHWKGSIPKAGHQAQILAKLGWEYVKRREYSRPANPDQLGLDYLTPVGTTDWMHVVDGIGLAQWGVEQLKLARTRVERRKRRAK